MSPTSAPAGRRERNTQAKLERIVAAASDLFAERGVDDVTTQEIADRADIGTGTLFLYAKTKGELLLLVQNAHYERALEQGRAAAAGVVDEVDAVLAILRPVVECNRVQVDNGRTYLREMVFGDPGETRHREALEIVARTEAVVADVLARDGSRDRARAATLARVVSAAMFLTLAATVNAGLDVDALVADLREQIAAVLGR
jgi:AcrR family transcriptional regulator